MHNMAVISVLACNFNRRNYKS